MKKVVNLLFGLMMILSTLAARPAGFGDFPNVQIDSPPCTQPLSI